MTVVAEVKLSDLLEKGGAYAGLAAFFGLAILVILYFAQARELKRLREWAGRAPERAQELEARVLASADVARKTARPAGAPATAAGAVAATPAATAAAPATAAGVAAKEAEPAPDEAVAATNGDPAAAATPA